jgi:isopenicillin N synthase-like dioxygenase
MGNVAELMQSDRPVTADEIPILDIGPYLAGERGARERIGARLRKISETIGFFYLAGHGVRQALIDQTFAEARRFHALPREVKRRIPMVPRIGYRGPEDTHGTPGTSYAKSLTSIFVIHRERTHDDPTIVPDHPFRGPNVWPQDLPDFRERVLEYYATIEHLAKRMMPLWAAALELQPDYFDDAFRDPYISLRLASYPVQTDAERDAAEGRYGIAPHTDNSLMTILAQTNVPGLAIEMPNGDWRVADIIPGTFMVNTGNMLVRWSNDQFLSTKHRVLNVANVERYSIPVFIGPNREAMIECLPSCTGPDRPARYPPIAYEELMRWYFMSGGVEEKSVGPDVASKGRWK